MTGKLECSVCEAKFQTQINTLTEPIDIFTEWLDETTDLQAEAAKNMVNRAQNRAQGQPQHQASSSSAGDDADGDD